MTTAHAILKCLDLVAPQTLPETTLLADVNLRVHEPVTPSALRRELEQLETGRNISSAKHAFKGTVYLITAQGQALLAS